MKYILPAALMLFSIAVLATGGGAQSSRSTGQNYDSEFKEKEDN